VSLLCLAHHAVRLWRSPRCWPPGATNPVQIRWKSESCFLPCFLGKMTVFDKTESLVMMPCAALSLLPSRRSCRTRRSCLNCMLIERMARRSCRRDGATRRDTLSLLPSRRSCPTRRSTLNHVLMQSMAKRSCSTRRSCLNHVPMESMSYPTRRSQTRGAAATQTRAATSPQSVLGGLASGFTRCAMERSIFFLPIIMENSRWSSVNNHGDRPRADCIGEPKRELCHHHGDRPLVDSIYNVCQGHGLPTQDSGEPKRELGHHHVDRPLVDSTLKGVPGARPSYPQTSWRAQDSY